MIMNLGKTLHARSRKVWHDWLKENYSKEKEIWLIFPKISSGAGRISYNDAVEEALSFGWIDSTVRKSTRIQPHRDLPQENRRANILRQISRGCVG
jgi:uncharacterized protein YdeI (YjbR/CyaY-like superfamily)